MRSAPPSVSPFSPTSHPSSESCLRAYSTILRFRRSTFISHLLSHILDPKYIELSEKVKHFSTHLSSSSASLPSSTWTGACPVQLCGSRRHQPHHRWVCQRGRIHPRRGQSTFSNISGNFGCDSISSTCPCESVGPLVTDTFRFSLESLDPPWVF